MDHQVCTGNCTCTKIPCPELSGHTPRLLQRTGYEADPPVRLSPILAGITYRPSCTLAELTTRPSITIPMLLASTLHFGADLGKFCDAAFIEE